MKYLFRSIIGLPVLVLFFTIVILIHRFYAYVLFPLWSFRKLNKYEKNADWYRDFVRPKIFDRNFFSDAKGFILKGFNAD